MNLSYEIRIHKEPFVALRWFAYTMIKYVLTKLTSTNIMIQKERIVLKIVILALRYLFSASQKKRREETIYKCSINIKLKFIRRPEKFKLVGHKRAQCNACSVYWKKKFSPFVEYFFYFYFRMLSVRMWTARTVNDYNCQSNRSMCLVQWTSARCGMELSGSWIWCIYYKIQHILHAQIVRIVSFSIFFFSFHFLHWPLWVTSSHSFCLQFTQQLFRCFSLI